MHPDDEDTSTPRDRPYITGTPSSPARRWEYIITVEDEDGDEASLSIYITVENKPKFLNESKIGNFRWKLNEYVHVVIPQAVGGVAPITYSLRGNSGHESGTPNGLPRGLNFYQPLRTINGSATKTMLDGSFTIEVTDTEGNSDSYTFRITVDLGLFGEEDTGPFTAISRSRYERTFFATNQNVRVMYTNGLPPGFRFRMLDYHPSAATTGKILIFEGTANASFSTRNVTVDVGWTVRANFGRTYPNKERLVFQLSFENDIPVSWQSGYNNSFTFPFNYASTTTWPIVYHNVTLPIASGNGRIQYDFISVPNAPAASNIADSLPRYLHLIVVEDTDSGPTTQVPILDGYITSSYRTQNYCFRATDEDGDTALIEIKIKLGATRTSMDNGTIDSTLSTSSCE